MCLHRKGAVLFTRRLMKSVNIEALYIAQTHVRGLVLGSGLARIYDAL